jgi:hypothetical protein
MVTTNETSIIITDFLLFFFFALLCFHSFSLFLQLKKDKPKQSTSTSMPIETLVKNDDDDDYCNGVNGMCATLNTQASAQ